MNAGVQTFDPEWAALIELARRTGLTIEEIREFLRNPERLKRTK
ncbi:anti-repressor SinI family protein [Thermobacillus composti]|nr:anti-repressor SinI family protein [Thermobacillus composti]REJ15955.1 MAG: hypothetical protein C6W59_08475 [Paenibacillaceae bacterium]